MLQSKFKKRLDTSDEFWNIFDACNASLKEQIGLYEAESR